MVRLANTKEQIRTLFAKTGNQCAFPGCMQPLIDDDEDYLAEICHIEGANEGSQRYNSEMTDEERRNVNNLVVLCRIHHAKVDKNPGKFTVSCLQKIKANHEKLSRAYPYQLADQALQQIIKEQLSLERDVFQKNLKWQEECDFAMDLQLSSDQSLHLNEILTSVSQIERFLNEISNFLNSLPNDIDAFLGKLDYDVTKYREVPYYQNPFEHAFWEMINIGVPNFLSNIQFHSKALEVHIEIQKLKSHPGDVSIRIRLDELKSKLLDLASTLAHAD